MLIERCSANAEAAGSNPVEASKNFLFFWGGGGLLRNCLNCDSTAMDTYSFHLYSRSSHNFNLCFILSRVDKLNKLAGSQCIGLQSSAGRALQRERIGHEFESR